MAEAWWKESIVYQVYWRSFRDTNGDGIGDLQGVIEKLDYIRSLGVTMLWINPFNESPDKDNGYDVSDYYAVMSKAGTMADFERLLAETHKRGMKLMMDVVLNHTSDQHPWFTSARSSRTHPKRDWYVWRDGTQIGADQVARAAPRRAQEARSGALGGSESAARSATAGAGTECQTQPAPPSNWRSYFTPSCWEWDAQTGQYYMHSFATEQPDLNWANPEVRQEMYRMLRFWLDKGVDGLRLDALALLAKPEYFMDADDPSDIRYLTHHPRLHDYLQEMHREVFAHYDIMTVGEIAFATPEIGVQFVDEARKELNTLFHFEVADEMPTWDLPRFKRIQRRWAAALQGRGFGSQFLNNHDHTRQVTRYGDDGRFRKASAKLLATMLHTLPGIPYIYQGEEIGMTGVRYETIDDYHDIAMMNSYAEEIGKGRDPVEVLRALQPLSRDNSRSPMQWSAERYAGFSTAEPWMKVNPNYVEIHVEEAERDPDSVLAYYRRLTSLRRQHPVMVYGSFTDLSGDDPQLYVYEREHEGIRWLVALNHGEHTRSFTLPKEEAAKQSAAAAWRLVLGNYEEARTDATSGDAITLRAYEARIYENCSLDANVES
ncbi:glycoside hydrolase family 13 protein [Paenibacillus sp. SYP-B4298]|uniref:glycoside hydrolase family 13 protein n=1 Tax=Paenibacillus sp. SYP-B4298 TaxID=2996034 RepID=UPI0022DE4D22|nr:alpha-glucosidase [Paenibacillus sp. SYP-B4298]